MVRRFGGVNAKHDLYTDTKGKCTNGTTSQCEADPAGQGRARQTCTGQGRAGQGRAGQERSKAM